MTELAVLAFLRRIAPGAAAVLAVLCGLALTYNRGQVAEFNKLQPIHAAELAKIQADADKAIADAEQHARHVEQQHATDMASVAQTLQEKTDHENQLSAQLDDAVRSGALRLRSRFTCGAGQRGGSSGISGVPKAASGAGTGDAASAGGLSTADAGFLVRFAQRADQVAMQLQACQSVVRSDRGVQP